MRKPNGYGHITKLAGNRRNPYAVRKITEWTEDGKPRYKYLSYHATAREAEKALAAYNKDPYSLSSKTLEQIYAEWLPNQTQKAPGTLKAYSTAWKKMEPLYALKMSQIDRVTLQEFYDKMDGTRNTSTNVKKLFSNLIKYAVKRGIMPVSALALHKAIDFSERDAGKTTERHLIPKEVIRKLWDLPNNEIAKQTLLYIYTGCRFSELHELQPEQCYPDHIEILHAKTEAGVRIVPLCDKILTLLPVEPIPSYDVFNKRFRELLPGYHIHDTRHTFITYMTEAGVDPRTVKAIVGHKTTDITEHYTHITLQAMCEAVNKMAAYL